MRPRTLFVYGTLVPGHAPPEVADDVGRLRRIGGGAVRGELHDLGEYPGAILSKGSKNWIKGAVFEMPDDPALLRRLDMYEEFDPQRPEASLFLRKRARVRLDDGSSRYCWIYTYNRRADKVKPFASDLVNQ